MATASLSAGPVRPRESGVWQYFKYLPEENKTVSLIYKSDVAQCGFSFKGKFSTNLKRNLQKNHPSDYKEFEESKKEKT